MTNLFLFSLSLPPLSFSLSLSLSPSLLFSSSLSPFIYIYIYNLSVIIILTIRVNINHLISNKILKACRLFSSFAHALCISRHILFPTAELWIVKYMQHTYTVYDEQLTRGIKSEGKMLCWNWLETLLLKCQSAVCAFSPLLSLPNWERR